MCTPITYPALYRQRDNVCTGSSPEELSYKLKTLEPVIGDFDPAAPGILIDATGKRFEVRCWRAPHASGILERFRRMVQFASDLEPVVNDFVQLTLAEFKREIELAVEDFGKATKDLDLAGDLRAGLRQASSYSQALAAIPEPI